MTRPGVARASLTAILISAAARADLAEDIQVVRTRLHAQGANVAAARPPRVFSSRETAFIPLPASVTSSTGPGCTTVMVLGAVSTVFALRLPSADSKPPGTDFLPSVAGARTLVHCGAQRRRLADLSLEMRSPRGIIETVVAESNGPLTELRAVLPHRDPGFVPSPARPPGPTPNPGPVSTRAAAFEATWAHDGVEAVLRRVVLGDSEGAGRLILELSPGCHRIAVLATDSDDSEARVTDVDAELAWVSGEIASADRTDSPDAVLTTCTARSELAIVAFAGLRPRGSVLLLRGRTDLPSGLPEAWGSEARARIAKALLDRHVPGPVSPPLYASLGVAGLTVLPIEVEPGRCYLAALALVEGAAKLVSLTAETGGARSTAHTDDPGTAAVATFCGNTRSRGTLEAEVHGVSLVWALGLWPMGRRRLGEDAP